ncbi:hypothetical protein D9Q81_07370 [Candidatus Korarchaeum cryptofilum]|uniref:Uncharacterized protein n=1 Tax=Candidatus Korarchaeum cryptofilum TaxID=498846 RepID=A0A3R9RHY0_9CREN|nr:hypothetical protein D9Q81_07370 [Candidatus Korarchaeum cryptofilum]
MPIDPPDGVLEIIENLENAFNGYPRLPLRGQGKGLLSQGRLDITVPIIADTVRISELIERCSSYI